MGDTFELNLTATAKSNPVQSGASRRQQTSRERFQKQREQKRLRRKVGSIATKPVKSSTDPLERGSVKRSRTQVVPLNPLSNPKAAAKQKREPVAFKDAGKAKISDNTHSKQHRSERHARPTGKTIVSSLFTGVEDAVTAPRALPETFAAQTSDLFSADTFASLSIDEKLVSTLETKVKATKLTTAQKLSMPHILMGRDVLLKSPTGTGKTLAFTVPIVQALQARQPRISRADGPMALILTPTRELALQTMEVMTSLLGPFVWVVPGVVMGGEKKKSEKARLRKGVNVLIATPGRLLDHMEHTECLNLKKVEWLVLDEADRLTDKGFEEDVKTIIQGLTLKKRQTVLVSATLTGSVKELAQISLRNPVPVDASKAAKRLDDSDSSDEGDSDMDVDKRADDGARFTTSSKLQQHFLLVPSKQRLVAMVSFLKWKVEADQHGKAVVFLASRDMVTFYQALLKTGVFSQDLKVSGLHGSMSQQERTTAFLAFCRASRAILLCTDVAARGLDLNKVKWIIHATAPSSLPEYIHRVGRTARIGASGQSLLMLLPSEVEFVNFLTTKGKQSIQELPLDEVYQSLMPQSGKSAGGAQHLERAKQKATDLQINFEATVLHDQALTKAARDAFSSFVKAKLHLGHVAKSFALRDAPQNIKMELKKQQQKKVKAPKKTWQSGGVSKEKFKALPEEAKQLLRETARKRKRTVSGQQMLADEFVGNLAVSAYGGPVTKKAKKKSKKARK